MVRQDTVIPEVDNLGRVFHSTDQSPKDSFRIGKPEVIYLFSGHYSSFLYLPYVEVKSLSFFKKKFDLR